MRSCCIKKILIGREGQTIVETALILPVILLILMGIFEFGRIFNTYLILTNASREGARVASVGGTDMDAYNSIRNTSVVLDPARLTVIIDPEEDERGRGLPVSVTVKYDLEIISPLLSAVIPNPFPLSSQTVMRIE